MMALVSKDLWNMRTAFVSMGIFAVVFISIFRDQSLMFMIAPIFFSTMVGSSLAVDDMCKWDLFAVSSGVRRKDIVLSKYMTGAVASVVGCCLGIVLMLAFGVVDGNVDYIMTLQMIFTGLLLALVICGLTIAVYFVTGDSTKGQYISIIVTVVAIIGLVSASAVVSEILGDIIPVMGIVAILCLVVVAVSYRASVSRFEARDLSGKKGRGRRLRCSDSWFTTCAACSPTCRWRSWRPPSRPCTSGSSG